MSKSRTYEVDVRPGTLAVPVSQSQVTVIQSAVLVDKGVSHTNVSCCPAWAGWPIKTAAVMPTTPTGNKVDFPF
jgi:hypothetical protein